MGGKYFIIDSNAKSTDEPWKAATRSTLWQIPKVDHIRFLPDLAFGENVVDEMGRTGINSYKPVSPVLVEGDISPYLYHLAALIPVESDQIELHRYFAHNIKFPGYKIPWAPMIQSSQGAGKGVFKLLMQHAMGMSYTYFPNAKELAESGSKFNGWMLNKLFILADEIKVDDRRDMIEILKPMISEIVIEVQKKGIDQVMADNFANWLFFSNFKDAIPANKNERRWAYFFSAIQSKIDLHHRGMDAAYFKRLYDWLRNEQGVEKITSYYMNYPIEKGEISQRAPDTSSTEEALRISLSPMEQLILEAVEDELPGFRGGWVSSLAVLARIKATGARRISARAITSICEDLGYYNRGRCARSYFQEDPNIRATLYSIDPNAEMHQYGFLQGYGE